MPFDPAVLSADPAGRADVLAALAGALAAADPGAAVRRHLHREGSRLVVGGTPIALPRRRAVVLAFGKAAPAMAAAALEALSGIPVVGMVAAPEAEALGPLQGIAAGHPLPDPGSLQAGRRLLQLAGEADERDLVLVLVSGGGSALAEAPAPGLELEDLEAVNRALLAAGAPIGEVNAVRKHLSSLKGGRLAQAAHPAPLATLLLSDVVGSPLDVIASGPTLPDPTTFADALEVLAGRGVAAPGPVRAALEEGAAGGRHETPKGGPAFAGPVVVVADGAAAARGAAEAARARGISAGVADSGVEGEARLVGRRLAEAASGLAAGEMAVFAGETTVTVTGPGRGGRNQEVALSAGMALEGCPAGALVASFGTDGIDGPTDAAGGIGDPGTVARGRARGLDPAAALRENGAYPYLEACGDLLRCGPTGTNVGDVMVAYRPKR